ncbi:MAG: NADPH-dependent FMN reductase [Chloroflexi bacterium]|nr:NADPH-dependent FMN reductase [Chloroflexota bacterium]MCC6893676.1 NADPH-dependent FMN reductase [Anaerolineae bacterium]
MVHMLTIGGSPSSPSRSAAVLEYARNYLGEHGFQTRSLSVRDLDSEELLCGKFNGPTMQQAKEIVASADGIIIGTPVYKAAYTGVLKAFLDLLPQNAFANKAVLPLATGGTLAHMLAIDYALKPVLANLGAIHILTGVYLLDQHLELTNDQDIWFTSPEAEERLVAGLDALIEVFANTRLRV